MADVKHNDLKKMHTVRKRKILRHYLTHKCDAMMHVLKDFINLKYSELLTEEISKSN